MSHPRQTRFPFRAFVLSIAAYAVPVVLAISLPGVFGDYARHAWLAMLVPVTVFAYYEGWEGVGLALTIGATVLVLYLSGRSLAGQGGLNTLDWQLLVDLAIPSLASALAIGWLASVLHKDLRQMETRERQLTIREEITQLPSQAFVDLYLESVFAAAQRGRPLVVVLFDIDDFRAYNKKHGHAAGDEVLRAFGRVLHRATRKMEISARYGGDEFLSVLAPAGARDALQFAKRVRTELASAYLTWGRVSVCAGIAEYDMTMSSSAGLVAAAREALNRARSAGKGGEAVHDERLSRAAPSS